MKTKNTTMIPNWLLDALDCFSILRFEPVAFKVSSDYGYQKYISCEQTCEVAKTTIENLIKENARLTELVECIGQMSKPCRTRFSDSTL